MPLRMIEDNLVIVKSSLESSKNRVKTVYSWYNKNRKSYNMKTVPCGKHGTVTIDQPQQEGKAQ